MRGNRWAAWAAGLLLAGAACASWPAGAQEEERPPAGVPAAQAPLLQEGDCWQYRNINIKRDLNETARCVARVLGDGYLMETAGRVTGLARYDRNLVWLGSIGADRTIRQPARSDVPLRMKFPLWPGKNWTDSYRAMDETLGGFYSFANIYIVEAVEEVEVPAGRFSAFRIKRIRMNLAKGEVVEGFTWYAPGVQNVVRIWNNWPGGTNIVLSAFRLSGERGSSATGPAQKPPPNKKRASQILVRDEAAAREVLRRIEGGEPFDALARELSVDPSKRFGGDIGYYEEGELLPELEAVLRDLKVGEVGGPVKTGRGYHILKRTG